MSIHTSAIIEFTRYFENLGYTVVLSYKEIPDRTAPYFVEFKVYTLIALDDSGMAWYNGIDSNYTMNGQVNDIKLDEVYLHGQVKWDGCSNWHFDEQDRVMLHKCDKEGLINIGKIMAACWDWANEIMGIE